MAEPKATPRADLLREFLEYDPESGSLTWINVPRRSKVVLGSRAGCPGERGYIVLKFAGSQYRAHRLIWVMMTGDEPSGLVDHINGDTADNRWANLRLANSHQNRWNSGGVRAVSGVRGVAPVPNSRLNPWRATIRVRGKTIYLGAFKTKAEAAEAYRKGQSLYHEGYARAVS